MPEDIKEKINEVLETCKTGRLQDIMDRVKDIKERQREATAAGDN